MRSVHQSKHVKIDEVIGLGSRLSRQQQADLRPQDLCSAGHLLVTEISLLPERVLLNQRRVTNIVGFNQDPDGDFGDWLSEPVRQAHPYPQNAFSCHGRYSDIAAAIARRD